jgi:hypothetical protein
MSEATNPSKYPLDKKRLLTPPEALDRPRNGDQSDDALGIDDLSDPSGGGKVVNPYITEAEKMSSKSGS